MVSIYNSVKPSHDIYLLGLFVFEGLEWVSLDSSSELKLLPGPFVTFSYRRRGRMRHDIFHKMQRIIPNFNKQSIFYFIHLVLCVTATTFAFIYQIHDMWPRQTSSSIWKYWSYSSKTSTQPRNNEEASMIEKSHQPTTATSQQIIAVGI